MNQKISQLAQALYDGGWLTATSKSPSVHPFIAVFADGEVDQVSSNAHDQLRTPIMWEKAFAVLSDKGDFIIRSEPSTTVLFLPGLLNGVTWLNQRTFCITYASQAKLFVDTKTKALEIRGATLQKSTDLLRAIMLSNGLDVTFCELPHKLTIVEANFSTN